MNDFSSITCPTLLIDEARCRANITQMAAKARVRGLRFRPHFKTHQSAEIGSWFRDEGVTACTVSSLTMARYFARHGWQEITIAFSLNLRELPAIAELARQVHLQLLVETAGAAQQLDQVLDAGAEVWLKVDCGYHRTGIDYADADALLKTAAAVQRSWHLQLRGLLAHFGDTYHAQGSAAVTTLYHENLGRLWQARQRLVEAGYTELELSIGDTPSCALVTDLGPVDEIRPGNFVFFDSTQYMLGACQAEHLAVALACPVISVYPARGAAVLYGGAVHLSKDHQPAQNQPVSYGLPALLEEAGWGNPLPGGWVASLTQEHGVVQLAAPDLALLKAGDLLAILPAHSCLTLQAMRELYTLDGRRISTMLSERETHAD